MIRYEALSHECARALRACAAATLTLSIALMPPAAGAKSTAQENPAAVPTGADQTPQALLWSAYGQPRESAHDLLLAIEKSPEHGLDPNRYAIEALYEALEHTATDSDLKRMDGLLSAALWTYANDLMHGAALVRPERNALPKALAAGPDRSSDLYKKMLAALLRDDLPAFFKTITPDLPEYLQLQAAHEHYQELELLDGWPELPKNTWIKPGDEDERVALLRARLEVTDEELPATDQPDIYDEKLIAAVIRFQKRHGLKGDGEVGPATLAALNITPTEKVRRIALNLNRLRQLPAEMPDDYIRVNIAEYELRLTIDNKEKLRMPVVVGSKKTPTPPMIHKVRHLVFNPYWYPPRGISVKEILPRLKREPEYLERQRFDVLRGKTKVDASNIDWNSYSWRGFPFRFRQKPGDKNSLGRVKFIFPNSQAIYLHDTPMKSLFGEQMRARSHGCVRLGRPIELAEALMEWDRGWGHQEVRGDLDKEKRKMRKFKERMDIYLLYLTARADETGVYFLPDVYRHDRPQAQWQQPAPALARYLAPEQSSTETVAAR